jgi:hypothetical protein
MKCSGPAVSQRSDQDRPAVWILACPPVPEGIVWAILCGLEEEGIPAQLRNVPEGPAEALAKQAADGSPLAVGIGVSGMEKVVALRLRELPSGRPLFELAAETCGIEELRRVGANAARLVKGDPLANLE